MRLVVFDGLDGCGKDTQARKVYDYYAAQGKKVVLRSHPSLDNKYGRKSKEALLKKGKWNHLLATLYFGADAIRSVRKYSHDDSIDVLIFCRYVLAVMYLPNGINTLLYKIVCKVLPISKYMFFLDISPEESLRRIQSRGEEEEMFENIEELKKARSKADKVIYNWNIIDADGTPDEIATEVRAILES